ncbi:MAG TPA: sigma-54 dependent transcriptional regulator [Bacteroidota bacterium]|nr:sigma-54 dependent transcriptional regulator [Bacteroidota bacterium]
MSQKILVVDDEQIIRESLSFVLKQEGFSVEEAANGKEALAKHEADPYTLIITDIEMPEMKGVELLKQIRTRTPEALVVIITAFASVETAIQALRAGAADYLLKPINFDDLLYRVKKLLEYRALALENASLRQELQRNYDFEQIIGKSLPMKRVFEIIKRVARSDGTVLITGKSGTGKELVARAIHYNSQRRENRFVPINCGAIVDTLFESELFGHKKGSFTGATMDKEGLLKVADGGTVFLDEVSEIPFGLQVKLLRALEQRELTPVGMTDPIAINVRIIAATNRDLRKEIENGKFRDDLYYRLNVVEIDLPSLKERQDDIPILSQHFLDLYKKQMGKSIQGFTNEAMRSLLQYSWKGEVRELENIVERSVIFCDGDFITVDHLPEYMHPAGTAAQPFVGLGTLKDSVHNFERQFIQQTLEAYHQNKEAAAKILGVSLSSLYRKIEELHIPSK